MFEERKDLKAWLLAEVRKLKGARRYRGKGRCPLYLGEEGVKPMLLDFLEHKKWKNKFLNKIR
jgi:hypothetical protein